MNSLLQAFYILFKSDAEKAAKDTKALEVSADAAALAVDALAASHATQAEAAVAGAGVTTAALAEVASAEAAAGAAAAVAGKESFDAHVLAWKAVNAETEAVVANSAAYVFNRSQRQELVGAARHMFDQLASGGSITRTLTSHVATLAEALGNGPGGLSAGVGALTLAAGRFVKAWGLPLAVLASLVTVLGVAKGSVKDLEAIRLDSQKMNFADPGDLDAIRKVIRGMGGDVKVTDKDLERFANRIDDVFGGKSLEGGKQDRIAKTLHAIGVSAKAANGGLKDTKTLLLDVAGALENKTKAQQSEAIRALGFSTPRGGVTDPAIEKLLTGGRAAMEEYIATEKKLGGVTKEQVEAAHKYRLETEILGDRLRDVRNTIAEYVLPILTSLTKAVRDGIEWWRLNSTLVTGFGVAFAAMAVVVSAATWGTLIPAFAAAAVAVLAATWPILLIGAAVLATAAAFAAAYEDVAFFLKGQPSLLGELVNKYGWVRATVQGVAAAFQWMGREGPKAWKAVTDGAKAFAQWLHPFLEGSGKVLGPILRLLIDLGAAVVKTLGPVLLQAAKVLWAITSGLVTTLGSTIAQLARLIGKAFAEVAKVIGPAWSQMFDGWLKQLDMLIYGVRKLFNLKPDAEVNAGADRAAPPVASTGIVQGRAALAFARSTPFAAQTPASLARSAAPAHHSVAVHIDKVEVHTAANDAGGIAGAFSDALADHVRTAAANFDNGVAR